MPARLVNEVIHFIPYIFLLGLASWLSQNELFLVEGAFAGSLLVLPYIVVVIGIALAWNFKVSTSVIGLFAIGVVYWLMATILPYGYTEDAFGQIFFAGITIAFPINLIWLCWSEERGVFSKPGLKKLSIIAAQLAVLFILTYWAADHGRVFLADLLNIKFIGSSYFEYEAMPQLGSMAFIIAGIAILVKYFKSRSPVQLGWFGTLIAIYWMFSEAGHLEQVAVFGAVASLSLVIAKIQMSYQMAFLDELTGIPARRALMTDIKKLGETYIIAMGDIDHFKKFNDTYGHDIGDQVLSMVASKLTQVTGGGKAYRYGGEEFSILFPHDDLEEAKKHLDRVREKIANSPFTIRSKDRPEDDESGEKARSKGHDDQVVSVTISIGYAAKERQFADAMQVMKAADEALYRAKKAGRNQVSV